jgi:5-methylthioadenosine/S-adenosylhomocysteine deaminase
VSSASRQLEAVDLLIEKAIVVTMDPRRTVIHDCALAITKDRIVAVGKTADLKARYTGATTIATFISLASL